MIQARIFMEILAILVELVIFLGNSLSKQEYSEKNNDFLIAVFFELLAVIADVIFLLHGKIYARAAVGKLAISAPTILGICGEAFLGGYLICLINERKIISGLYAKVMYGIAVVSEVIVVFGTISNQIYYYTNGHVFRGDKYFLCSLCVTILGIYEIFIIISNHKILGINDTLIALTYFLLPLIAVIVKLIMVQYNFIYAVTAVSLLIINNLLMARERNEAKLKRRLAEESEKNKSNFLANMSHEIRTPINAVVGLNELIIRESTEKEIVDYAKDIKSSSNQLLNIVNDILDFSKIESGKMSLVPVDYDFASLLNDVVNMTHIKAEEKGLDLDLEIDSSIPHILHGDEVRIKQILANILNNAVKYTKEGFVRLWVSYEKTGDFEIKLNVSIEDSGIGLKPEEKEKLFQPFERIDQTQNRNIEGTGLGMAITKNLLALMDSKLNVSSVYGKGSVFSFSIIQGVENWEGMGNYAEAFQKIHNQDLPYQVKLVAPDAVVLAVDDMPINLTVLEGLLKQTKIIVDKATSGEEALAHTMHRKYDLILLDHMMPGLDGVDTYRELKKQPGNLNYKTPIIVLTANAVSGVREEYKKIGFTDYLSKPISTEHLEKMLIKYLPEDKVTICDKDELTMENSDKDVIDQIRMEFAISALDIMGKLQSYYDNKDIKNYTTLVHGLKSNAHYIGEMQLSELAAELEQAGKNKDLATIEMRHPTMMSLYELISKEILNSRNEFVDKEKLVLITSEELEEAISVIKAAIDDMDYDTINSVMHQLSKYRLPSDFEVIYREMETCMAEVNYDGMNELFATI